MKPTPVMTDPLLSIVIPNWNGAHFLPPCLDSLLAQTYPHIEIMVVDNDSHDDSKLLLAVRYPTVRVIALAVNAGFTGACNAGLRAAGGTYIALLNNDTEVDSGWAEAIVDAFQRHPQVGSVASKMLLYDRRDHLHTAGDFFTVDGRAGNRGAWQPDDGRFDDETFVFSACGGSAVYRRALLDDVGLLDDDFFFSGEDVDLGWRAQLAGWPCLYTPRAIVYHHVSATGGGTTASFYDARNSIAIVVKNYPAALWRRHGGRVIAAHGRRFWQACRAWRGREARATVRGILAGIGRIPHFWRKRRHIQPMRRVSIEHLESILTPPHP